MKGIRVNAIDDLRPALCEAIELVVNDGQRWGHAFALPSRTFSGHWHVGHCIRPTTDDGGCTWSYAPVTAEEVLRFVVRQEPGWGKGLLYRWATNGSDRNPMDMHNDYESRLFQVLREGWH